MSAAIWNPTPVPIFSLSGNLASGALAMFYLAGTSQPMAVYQDSALTTPHAFPIVAGATGVFPPIFLPYTDYRVRVTESNGALIFDADGISNPAPATSGGGGGGGGIVVDATQIFQTGDPIWRLRSGSIDGFVRMNSHSIGSSVSGATERANSDTQNLFYYLWNNLSDSVAPVSTGRGASASADWAANKTITIPTMQGLVAGGLDDMGATAASNIQVITTASATNGSASVTVASTAGLARGMKAVIDGNATGSIISISGLTVTLSTVFGGVTNASASFRASFVSDAQSLGAWGGAQTFTATSAEMPSHNHGVTDPGHTHTYTPPSNTSAAAGIAGVAFVGGSTNTGSATTGISIQNTGGGLPSQIIQPTRLGTFYMKL